MTVKSYYGSAAYDPSVKPRVALPAEVTQGHVHVLVSTKAILNGDSATSVINFGAIPSNARIIANSRLDHDSITSLTDFDLGVGKTVAGVHVLQDIDALIDGATLATAGSKAMTNVPIENLGQALWQLAGYTDDPGGDLDIVGNLKVDSGANGDITLTLLFSTP